MLTCGDLGGQACPWHGLAECERHADHATPTDIVLSLWGSDHACQQMRMAVRLATRIERGNAPYGGERLHSREEALAWAAEVEDE